MPRIKEPTCSAGMVRSEAFIGSGGGREGQNWDMRGKRGDWLTVTWSGCIFCIVCFQACSCVDALKGVGFFLFPAGLFCPVQIFPFCLISQTRSNRPPIFSCNPALACASLGSSGVGFLASPALRGSLTLRAVRLLVDLISIRGPGSGSKRRGSRSAARLSAAWAPHISGVSRAAKPGQSDAKPRYGGFVPHFAYPA